MNWVGGTNQRINNKKTQLMQQRNYFAQQRLEQYQNNIVNDTNATNPQFSENNSQAINNSDYHHTTPNLHDNIVESSVFYHKNSVADHTLSTSSKPTSNKVPITTASHKKKRYGKPKMIKQSKKPLLPMDLQRAQLAGKMVNNLPAVAQIDVASQPQTTYTISNIFPDIISSSTRAPAVQPTVSSPHIPQPQLHYQHFSPQTVPNTSQYTNYHHQHHSLISPPAQPALDQQLPFQQAIFKQQLQRQCQQPQQLNVNSGFFSHEPSSHSYSDFQFQQLQQQQEQQQQSPQYNQLQYQQPQFFQPASSLPQPQYFAQNYVPRTIPEQPHYFQPPQQYDPQQHLQFQQYDQQHPQLQQYDQQHLQQTDIHNINNNVANNAILDYYHANTLQQQQYQQSHQSFLGFRQ